MKLKVVSYNIKHGDIAGHDFSLIAADILQYEPDLVGIQELDLFTARSPGLDELALIAQAMGYEHYRFARAIDYKCGQYGCGIISKYPIDSFEVKDLKVLPREEGRSCSHAVIEIGARKINFFNTHTNCGIENGSSQNMFSQIAELICGKDYGIITGDFNIKYKFGFFDNFKGYSVVNKGDLITTADNGNSIDNICYTKEFKLLSYGAATKTNSDHFPIYAEFDMEEA